MSGGLGHLMDPLVGGDFFSSIIPMLMEMSQQRAMQSDPNLLALVNNRIAEYNSSNAYNPATGQHQAGNPFGDAASGYGGAFGHDRNGNPLSPSGAMTRYGLEQVQGSQGRLGQGQNNLGRLASGAGGNVVAPGAYTLDVPQGLDPGAVQGVDQSTRTPPTPLVPVGPPADPLGDWIGGIGRGIENFIGSFAVGTTSVPRTGLAQVHQGEMIVPASQNPLAGTPSRPLAASRPMAPSPPPPAGGNGALVSPPPPQYNTLSPGLNPQVQQQIINRDTESIDVQSQAARRQMAEQAALRGQGGSGALSRQMFDAELARQGQVANLQRDVGLEAANRQFTDSLAANNFNLERFLGESGLGLQQGQLDLARQQFGLDAELGRGGLALQGELGRGNLANDQFLAQLQAELGRGQLGQGQQEIDLNRQLGQGRLALDRQMGMGQLNLSQNQLALQRQLGLGQQSLDRELGMGRLGNETMLAQLQGELGRGGLNLQNRQFGLDQEMGRGQLSLGRGQLSNDMARRQLDERLGMGQLGVQQSQVRNESRGLDIQQLLGQGNLANDARGLDIQQLLGQGGLANDARGLDIQRMLGQGNLANDARGLDIQRMLGQGNLANDARGLDIQQLLGQGNLSNDRFGLETNRQLGQGQLDFTNRQFDANYGRDLNNDAFGQYQYEQDRNDNMMNTLWQQQFLNGQQNQYGDLMALLSQFAGQSGQAA